MFLVLALLEEVFVEMKMIATTKAFDTWLLRVLLLVDLLMFLL